VAIIFTTILGLILIVTGDLSTLAGVTVTLLLFVFIVVNATVLVLRRDKVAHEHFHAPTILPILGVIVCIGLLTQREADVWWRAGALLALGVVLFAINRAVSGPPQDMDADRIG
jgi:amino acid transporter